MFLKVGYVLYPPLPNEVYTVSSVFSLQGCVSGQACSQHNMLPLVQTLPETIMAMMPTHFLEMTFQVPGQFPIYKKRRCGTHFLELFWAKSHQKVISSKQSLLVCWYPILFFLKAYYSSDCERCLKLMWHLKYALNLA